MSKNIMISRLCLALIGIALLVSILPVTASQTAPLPDHPAPGYHPGFFGEVTADQASIPPVVNTYDGEKNGTSDISPVISFTLIPGNSSAGPVVTGYISGYEMQTRVNISGRESASEGFRYLATIDSDEHGFFAWPLPEWASDITEVMAGLSR